MSRSYLNALGMVTCLGESAAATLAGLRAESTRGLARRDDLRETPAVVATVSCELPSKDSFPRRFASRNNQLALAALRQIERDVQTAVARFGRSRVGVIVGSSTSGILEGGAAITQQVATGSYPSEFDYAQQEIGNPSEFLADFLDVNGPAYTVSSACTSGAKALAAASRLIRTGLCDAVVAGGVDSLCPLTVRGFSALESVAEERCLPFSANRDGITIGEGAALFLMSREAGSVCLSGAGESLDAHHISAPDPQGIGAEIAIRQALDVSGIDAADIGYINLHGTGTRKNDEMEAAVVHRLFGSNVPVSSAKGLLGHTLGAAGAIEAGLCWLLLQSNGGLIPHAWDGLVDPELPALNFCSADTRSGRPLRYALSNSFAFGGSNAVLVLERTGERA